MMTEPLLRREMDTTRPTRILGIAPYEGMRSLMVSIAETMPGVEMTAFVGDLEPGVTIVSQYTESTVDVVLSRGGTAEMIRSHTTIPVVEIELSVYDILRSLKLAESTSSRFSVVGFPSITQSAAFLSEILRNDIDLHTIHNTQEARKALKELSDQGRNTVLCDMVTNSLAQEYGIPALLITSGRESIEAAIRQAVSLHQTLSRVQARAQLMQAVLETQADHLILCDEDGKVCYAHRCGVLPAPVEAVEEAMRSQPLPAGKRSRMMEHQRTLWTVTAQPVQCGGACYAVITARSNPVGLELEKNGITFFGREETYDHFYHSFYGITNSSHLEDGLEEYARSDSALMIVGEPGTGKDQMVRLLYAKSRLSDAPLCSVDCALLHEQGWQYLLENEASPLYRQGITIHFRNLLYLSDSQFTQLTMMMRDTGVNTRSRLIFTASVNAGGLLHPRHQQLLSLFGCLPVSMPPLRSRREDIPYLASLYISTLNLKDTRDIAGFVPEALSLLQEYDWPANHDQFVRVLQELFQLTHTPYISLEDVSRLLLRERQLYAASAEANFSQWIGNYTLDQINQAVASYVLKEEKGNQTATAQRLGISRTTLWRMLQRKDKKD